MLMKHSNIFAKKNEPETLNVLFEPIAVWNCRHLDEIVELSQFFVLKAPVVSQHLVWKQYFSVFHAYNVVRSVSSPVSTEIGGLHSFEVHWQMKWQSTCRPRAFETRTSCLSFIHIPRQLSSFISYPLRQTHFWVWTSQANLHEAKHGWREDALLDDCDMSKQNQKKEFHFISIDLFLCNWLSKSFLTLHKAPTQATDSYIGSQKLWSYKNLNL